MTVTTRTNLPQSLLDAFESGDLTRNQIEQLIRVEAEQIGLSFDEAMTLARHHSLPKDPVGTDIQFLAMMLEDAPVVADE